MQVSSTKLMRSHGKIGLMTLFNLVLFKDLVVLIFKKCEKLNNFNL